MRLSQMSDVASDQEFSSLLACFCSWGNVAELLEMTNTWLAKAFNVKEEGDKKGKKLKLDPKPHLAVKYLERILVSR